MKPTTLLLAALLTLLPATAYAQMNRPAARAAGEAGPSTSAEIAGARFDIAIDGGQLIVRAVGQDAVDLLYPATPEEATERRAYNRMTGDLFDELSRSESSRLEALIGLPDRANAVADITRMLALHRDAFGPMKRYEVLGSAPRPGGGTYTYVVAHFGAESIAFRLIWNERNLMGFYPGTPEYMTSRIVPAPALPPAHEIVMR